MPGNNNILTNVAIDRDWKDKCNSMFNEKKIPNEYSVFHDANLTQLSCFVELNGRIL